MSRSSGETESMDVRNNGCDSSSKRKGAGSVIDSGAAIVQVTSGESLLECVFGAAVVDANQGLYSLGGNSCWSRTIDQEEVLSPSVPE